jgi:hypothetical protein
MYGTQRVFVLSRSGLSGSVMTKPLANAYESLQRMSSAGALQQDAPDVETYEQDTAWFMLAVVPSSLVCGRAKWTSRGRPLLAPLTSASAASLAARVVTLGNVSSNLQLAGGTQRKSSYRIPCPGLCPVGGRGSTPRTAASAHCPCKRRNTIAKTYVARTMTSSLTVTRYAAHAV